MSQSTQRKYMYQYGSEAREYSELVPRPKIEPDYKPSQVPQKKLDIAFGLKLSFCGVLAFVCAFIYINQYSVLITKQKQLGEIKNQVREVKSTVSLTESKISEKLNLDYIRDRASKELGMHEPAPHQIVYIELPKQSYTVYDN